MSSLRSRGGVFISYRREETAANAGRLYDRLSDRYGENRVFMDVDSIAVGVDFTRAIKEAVYQCSVMLALIGRDWSVIADSTGKRRIDNPDDFVRVEIETALQRDIRVVPVLVDGAALPQADDLPPSLRPLLRRQALELSHTGFRSEVSRLIVAVDEILEIEPDRPAEAPKTSVRGPVTGQRRWSLELIGDEGAKKTFRLSSDREAHDIAVHLRWPGTDTISVDGITVVKAGMTEVIDDTEYPLPSLSSILGSDVTISVRRGYWASLRVKSITLKIGDQILICQTGIK
jgi:hypothetical protein